MPPFATTDDRVRPCGGTCGRMTRPKSMPLTAAPGTVTRHDGTYCPPCKRKADPAPEEALAAESAEREARKARLAEERVAAAYRARQAIEVERAARRRRRIARSVGLGQSMVRI